ncbi:MAG: glutamine amidotransferase [Microcoleus sp. PH2017_25_DOB_D_A]|uniref:glutamine amidotransferase n=1 Tax=unclassified Microcoleus TaxID=2642155 RepID=UPI001DD59AE8|nr:MULTISPECIES: glutamine amidotransferase [unclassified Microcoleus]MCC3412097.1 glutamine amidotransferase [Microcoleus sp. PH2017_02_FOX_O_A]MCC3417956.1 glutamine amidotransferase [Microcoleus sp. PH2017_07_MST_O_A]MCC3533330.1 glutamine amidotransferase [Microcoleus sp. PH2017_25_DOB_D_A]MCC3483447.1 glutamine amidotransferase [Microcoleus sp. PH2017_14_LAR_D_A]MCC3489375.1 glutamine amidotransferase [Microcoleus sp. PH2017_16_JOR_D_A]
MTTLKHATVIRHIAFEDLGSLAEALNQQNYTVRYLEAGSDDLTQIDRNTSLLIILGGPIGAYDEQDYPFLIDELRLLEYRLANDLPTLGICLGAQLMARALGAKVYPGLQKEIGWSPLNLSLAGQQTPLAHLAGDKTAVLHWHGDTFDLPTDSTHLAASAIYQNQAFSWKKGGLALQFHPEVTAQGLERWFIGHACEIGATPDITVAKLREDTIRYAGHLSVQAAKFWEDWLASLPQAFNS